MDISDDMEMGNTQKKKDSKALDIIVFLSFLPQFLTHYLLFERHFNGHKWLNYSDQVFTIYIPIVNKSAGYSDEGL